MVISMVIHKFTSIIQEEVLILLPVQHQQLEQQRVEIHLGWKLLVLFPQLIASGEARMLQLLHTTTIRKFQIGK